jgi:hypothetical protein
MKFPPDTSITHIVPLLNSDRVIAVASNFKWSEVFEIALDLKQVGNAILKHAILVSLIGGGAGSALCPHNQNHRSRCHLLLFLFLFL